jgi:hypothetical protein
MRISDEGDLVQMDKAHAEVHDGNFWSYNKRIDSLANDASTDFLIVTGEAKVPHSVIQITAGGACWIDWHPSPTISSNGTDIPLTPHNGLTPGTPITKAFFGPTVDSPGDVGSGLVLPGGRGVQSAIGADIRNGDEIILAPSKKFLIRVTSKAGSGVVIAVGLQFEFYEEPVES